METATNIDFNCDLGEGLDNEHLLMPYLSSCNIACGGHAGSSATIDRVMGLALQHLVHIGAHPSYPDKENFGRNVMQLSEEALEQSLSNQLQLFKARAALQQAHVHHVKPHGALYNQIAVDANLAHQVTEIVGREFPNALLYVPYGSVVAQVAKEKGMPICYEAFADRNYNADLTLVSRDHPKALITDPEAVVAHVQRMWQQQKVLSIQGSLMDISAATFCIHGDHPNALAILQHLHQEFLVD